MNKQFVIYVQGLGALARINASNESKALNMALAKLGQVGIRNFQENQGYTPALYEGECVAVGPSTSSTTQIPSEYGEPLQWFWYHSQTDVAASIEVGALATTSSQALEVLAEKCERFAQTGFRVPPATGSNWQLTQTQH